MFEFIVCQDFLVLPSHYYPIPPPSRSCYTLPSSHQPNLISSFFFPPASFSTRKKQRKTQRRKPLSCTQKKHFQTVIQSYVGLNTGVLTPVLPCIQSQWTARNRMFLLNLILAFLLIWVSLSFRLEEILMRWLMIFFLSFFLSLIPEHDNYTSGLVFLVCGLAFVYPFDLVIWCLHALWMCVCCIC